MTVWQLSHRYERFDVSRFHQFHVSWITFTLSAVFANHHSLVEYFLWGQMKGTKYRKYLRQKKQLTPHVTDVVWLREEKRGHYQKDDKFRHARNCAYKKLEVILNSDRCDVNKNWPRLYIKQSKVFIARPNKTRNTNTIRNFCLSSMLLPDKFFMLNIEHVMLTRHCYLSVVTISDTQLSFCRSQ